MTTNTTTSVGEMTDVEILRHASKLMQAHAVAATQGPWTSSLVWSPDSHATSGIYSNAHPTGTPASEVVASGRRGARGFGGIRDPRNARHIVSWQPPVALAVAAWLDREVFNAERRVPVYVEPSALAVARAYIEAAAR
ncbi:MULTISPECIES: hypothetical protein [unclassified Micromonospora]|uniref:hypothetical protein n=1 Tax=unclassified Micromonospora TaxID=2617518 RepID=UPI00332B754C